MNMEKLLSGAEPTKVETWNSFIYNQITLNALQG